MLEVLRDHPYIGVVVVLVLAGGAWYALFGRKLLDSVLPPLDVARRCEEIELPYGKIAALLRELEGQLPRSPDLTHAVKEVASCAATAAFENGAADDFHEMYEHVATESMLVALWEALSADKQTRALTRSDQVAAIEASLYPALFMQAIHRLELSSPNSRAMALDQARGEGTLYEITYVVLHQLLEAVRIRWHTLRATGLGDAFVVAISDVARQHGELMVPSGDARSADGEERLLHTNTARAALRQILWESTAIEGEDSFWRSPEYVDGWLRSQVVDEPSGERLLWRANTRLLTLMNVRHLAI